MSCAHALRKPSRPSNAGSYSLNLAATIKNCSSQPASWTFSVYFEQDSPPLYTLSTGGAVQRPGDSLMVFFGSFGNVPDHPAHPVISGSAASPGRPGLDPY